VPESQQLPGSAPVLLGLAEGLAEHPTICTDNGDPVAAVSHGNGAVAVLQLHPLVEHGKAPRVDAELGTIAVARGRASMSGWNESKGLSNLRATPAKEIGSSVSNCEMYSEILMGGEVESRRVMTRGRRAEAARMSPRPTTGSQHSRPPLSPGTSAVILWRVGRQSSCGEWGAAARTENPRIRSLSGAGSWEFVAARAAC
jgi:hypothetical protein